MVDHFVLNKSVCLSVIQSVLTKIIQKNKKKNNKGLSYNIEITLNDFFLLNGHTKMLIYAFSCIKFVVFLNCMINFIFEIFLIFLNKIYFHDNIHLIMKWHQI